MENQAPSIEDCKRYMHNEMSDSEKNAFEDRIRNDAAFRQRAEANLQALQALGREEIRRQALEGYEEEEREEQRKRNNRYRLGGIAAAILLLVSVCIYAFFPTGSKMETLYEEHFEILAVGTRSSGGDQDSLWNGALDSYEVEGRQDFEKAASMFEELLKDSLFNLGYGNEAHLYLGISRMELGEFDAAIEAFEGVSPKSASFYGDAVWYAALSRLRMGDEEVARQAFQDISASERWSTKRRDSARKILESLEDEE